VEQWAILNRPISNGFNYDNYPIVKPVNGGKEFMVEEAHWELIPSMVQSRAGLPEFRKKYNTLNAKGENLLSSPFYKNAALKRRCLVLSSGFYEWRKYTPRGSKKEISYPYHIKMKDREYFYMAGIWQPWTDKETGETIDTFSIVTTAANKLMEQVHNSKKRMPNMLPEPMALEWIQEDLSEQRIAEIARYQIDDDMLECHTISKDFRIMDDPTEEYAYPDLPPLGEDGKAPAALSLF
jgi:putative SOS response-associated peptidase YedK